MLNFISENPATKAFRAGQEADRAQRLADLRIDQGQEELDYTQEQRQNAREADAATRSYLRTVGQGNGGTAPQEPAAQSPVQVASTALMGGLRTAGRAPVQRSAMVDMSSGGRRLALTEDDIEALTRTAVAEAGNQGEQGLAGVVYTILNRAAHPAWGGSIDGIVNAKNQFEPVTRAGDWRNLPAGSPEQRALIRSILERGANGQMSDPTAGGTYFLNRAISQQRGTDFGQGRDDLRTASIGDHAFYAPGVFGESAVPVPTYSIAMPASAAQPASYTSGPSAAPAPASPVQAGTAPQPTTSGLRTTPMQTPAQLQSGLGMALANVPGAGGKAMEAMLAGATHQEKLALQVIQLAEKDADAAILYAQQAGYPLPPQGEEMLRSRAGQQAMLRALKIQIEQRNANKPYFRPDTNLVIGEDEEGNPIYIPRSQAAGMPVGAKPSNRLVQVTDENGNTVWMNAADAEGQRAGSSAAGRQSVFQQKQAAWLAANPGDQQGALAYASGRATMQPAQMMLAAKRLAAKEADGMIGRRPSQADIDARANQIYQDLQKSVSATGGAAPAAASPPGPQPAAPVAPPAAAVPAAPTAAAPPPGKGTEVEPFQATTQDHVNWFRNAAPPGAVLSVNGQLYTK